MSYINIHNQPINYEEKLIKRSRFHTVNARVAVTSHQATMSNHNQRLCLNENEKK